MNPLIGWGLALAAVIVAWHHWRWQGTAAAFTLIVFWVLLQFNRSIRVMKNAASAPIGHVDSAVMLHTKLRLRMTLLQVITMTRSLGRRLEGEPERWMWRDESGAVVTIHVDRGRVTRWNLERTES